MRLFLLLLPLLAAPALAQDTLNCAGDAPVWRVVTDGQTATFTFRGGDRSFSVPSVVDTENPGTATAYTLIGDRDTAILIVTEAMCNSSTLMAHVLTQENSEPILLTGCCVRG